MVKFSPRRRRRRRIYFIKLQQVSPQEARRLKLWPRSRLKFSPRAWSSLLIRKDSEIGCSESEVFCGKAGFQRENKFSSFYSFFGGKAGFQWEIKFSGFRSFFGGKTSFTRVIKCSRFRSFFGTEGKTSFPRQAGFLQEFSTGEQVFKFSQFFRRQSRFSAVKAKQFSTGEQILAFWARMQVQGCKIIDQSDSAAAVSLAFLLEREILLDKNLIRSIGASQGGEKNSHQCSQPLSFEVWNKSRVDRHKHRDYTPPIVSRPGYHWR